MLYHKIDSVYLRDPDNKFKTFLAGKYARPEFDYLADLKWIWTEKVDGTNIRIHIEGEPDLGAFSIGGRTERSEIHPKLYEQLSDIGGRATGLVLGGLTLFGEGYGAGIQKGGVYRPDMGFILFDVAVTSTGLFLDRENVADIARKLGVPVVPVIGLGSLPQAVSNVWERSIESALADDPSRIEGLVMRPATEVRDRLGHRIITKVKIKDFPQGDTK